MAERTVAKPAPKTEIFFRGIGRRKTAVAQVHIQPGKGSFVINGQTVELDEEWMKPLALSGNDNRKLDISVVVRGGGKSSQIEAIRLGITRALIVETADLKSTFRKAGLVTRDPRAKERKKPGLKRARRAPQWSKR